MKARILRGMGAGSYSQLVTICIQLLSIPVFLSVWSLDRYGIWLVLSTLPAYITLSDFGITTAVSSKMTMLSERGSLRHAQVMFGALQAALLLIAGFLSTVSVIVGSIVVATDRGLLDAVCAAVLLVAGVCVAQFSGAFEGVLRATHRLPFALYSSANTRLLEWIGFISGLMIFGSFTGVAVFGLAGRIVGTVIIVLVSLRAEGRHFRTRPRFRRMVVLKPLLSPAIGGLSYSLSSALVVQGSTIVAATFLSPAAAAIFSTYRTVSRVMVQATAVVSHAAWPELTRLFSSGDFDRFTFVQKRLSAITLLGTIIASILVVLCTPLLLSIWTHDRVPFILPLSIVMAMYSIAAASWHTARVALFSVNGQGRLGGWLLAAAAVGLVMMTIGAALFDIEALAFAIFFTELISAITCFHVLNLVKREWKNA